jgi:hypothetical protein
MILIKQLKFYWRYPKFLHKIILLTQKHLRFIQLVLDYAKIVLVEKILRTIWTLLAAPEILFLVVGARHCDAVRCVFGAAEIKSWHWEMLLR